MQHASCIIWSSLTRKKLDTKAGNLEAARVQKTDRGASTSKMKLYNIRVGDYASLPSLLEHLLTAITNNCRPVHRPPHLLHRWVCTYVNTDRKQERDLTPYRRAQMRVLASRHGASDIDTCSETALNEA